MVEMDSGIAEIMNPYIARAKAGIKEYEQNAILVEISEKMESYCRSFFSRDDLGDSSVILMHEFERYFKNRMDGPPLSLHCQPALPRTARCQCSGKGGGWACKTQWERDMKTGVRKKKLKKMCIVLKNILSFANDRLLRLLTD